MSLSRETTQFEPMTETYSSYMARLAQNAFKNKMLSRPGSSYSSSPASSSSMRRAPPPPTSTDHDKPPSPQQQRNSVEDQNSNNNNNNNNSPNYQQVFRSAPGSQHKLPKSPPPPPSLTILSQKQETTISSSAVDFLDTLSEREKLYQLRFGGSGGSLAAPPAPPIAYSSSSATKAPITTSPSLLEEILALQASSQSWRSRHNANEGKFQAIQSSSSQEQQQQQKPFDPRASSNNNNNPGATLMALQLQEQARKSSSALLSALNNLKQTPIVRSSSAKNNVNDNEKSPQKQHDESNATAADDSTSSSSYANGAAFFEAAQQRLNSSQDFSTSNRISKFLGQQIPGRYNQQQQQQRSGASPHQKHDDDQKISNLFSSQQQQQQQQQMTAADAPYSKMGLNADLENARKQMSITSYSVNHIRSGNSATGGSPTLKATRESLRANIGRSTEAQRRQHLEAERVLDQVQGLNRIEQRITDHQNAHTKFRAQRLMDLDRARWEVQRVDFRVLEVQSQMDAACVALQERLLSRVATIRQLQDDAVRQSEMRLHSAVKGEHDRRVAGFREQTAERASTVESLRVALQQLAAHVEVQCARIEHDLSKKAINAAMDRLAAIRHTLNAEAGRTNRSVESMANMVRAFAEETKKQLAELRDERLLFHDRMARRVEEMRAARIATDARHRAKVVTPSSFRAPSM